MTRNKLADYVRNNWADGLFLASAALVSHGFSLLHASLGFISLGAAGFAFLILSLKAAANGHADTIDA